MKTVRLITCDGAFQARLIQGALENEGIASVLHNENTSNILRGFTPTISGVDIFVYEDDYERAMALLERNQMIPEQLKYCPCCHSPHIKFVLKSLIVSGRSWPPYSVSWPAHLRARRIGNMYAKTVKRTLKRPWHDKEKRHKTPPHPTQNEHQTCTIHRYARHHGHIRPRPEIHEGKRKPLPMDRRLSSGRTHGNGNPTRTLLRLRKRNGRRGSHILLFGGKRPYLFSYRREMAE